MSAALNQSVISYRASMGRSLQERCAPYENWLAERSAVGVWPYARTMQSSMSSRAFIGNSLSQSGVECINFSSQDYLAFAQSPEIHQAAIQAIGEFGVHSAGSPALVGRTPPMVELERRIAQVFETESCTIYPTGWAAGFGVLSGLVGENDFVVMDALIHNCLAEGANSCGAKIIRFLHNDMTDLERHLLKIRTEQPGRGVFVLTESLFSMDADSPDVNLFVATCRRHNAISILDVAHDFGAMGDDGLGAWGLASPNLRPDIVMGSFSKTFASNGGFVASIRSAIEYLKAFSAPWVFSNAISPVQASIVLTCLDLCFSEEGKRRRESLLANASSLRGLMQNAGFILTGSPSPLVPVTVGSERLARLMSREIVRNGLAANLVEFPAVALGKARFRFQLMSSHTNSDIKQAVQIMSKSRDAVIRADSLSEPPISNHA